jgi:hypothetical protein
MTLIIGSNSAIIGRPKAAALPWRFSPLSHWHWTPNPYLAAGIGVGLAWIAIVEWRDGRGRR